MLCLTLVFPGRPSHACDATLVPLSHTQTSAPSKESESLFGERDFNQEENNYDIDAGGMGPAVNPLAALLDGIPGFYTAQLQELLRKLSMPDDDEVPGPTMSEAVEVSYPVI